MVARQVFISHSSRQSGLAHEICNQLENAGISCWIAPRDIDPGRRYAEGILQGLGDCAVFLLLYSVDSTSAHVLNEVEEAASQEKAMLVVRTDDADPGANPSIRFFLRSHQWYDASSGAVDQHFGPIVSAVRGLVAEVAQSGPEPSPIATAPADQVAPPRNLAVGVDVSATKIRAAVLDLDAPDLNGAPGATIPLAESERNPGRLMEVIIQTIHGLLDEFSGPQDNLVGIGVSMPGQVDVRAGTLKFGPNLFSARNLPVRAALTRAFPRTAIRVDNDLRCAARTELHLGIGREYDDFAWVFVGGGVGSACVVDGRILFGHNYCAGEIGHMKMAASGTPCACGQVGCLETLVKAQAIRTLAQAKAIDAANRDRATTLTADTLNTPEEIVQAIESGDEVAREVAEEIGAVLGAGLANYLNLVNPAAVVLGGGLMAGFYFHMIGAISEGIRKNALAEVVNTPVIQTSQPEGGLAIGAALMFHPEDQWPFA